MTIVGVQEAAVRPVTGGGEKGKHEEGAVYAKVVIGGKGTRWRCQYVNEKT